MAAPKKVMITGASGKLGSEVNKLFPHALIPSHKEMPVEDRERVFGYMERNKPDVVIHLAAMVSPMQCEKEKALAWDVIVNGTINLVDACERIRGCYFVLMSTPCVFSGEEDKPKDEDHHPAPDNYYGICKIAQEMVVKRSRLKWMVVRSNFIARDKYPYPKAFVDRKSRYLFADVLAEAIKGLVDQGKEGIFHIVGDRLLSMYDFAKLCPDSEGVGKLTLGEFYEQNPGAARLTKNMVLKSNKLDMYKFR